MTAVRPLQANMESQEHVCRTELAALITNCQYSSVLFPTESVSVSAVQRRGSNERTKKQKHLDLTIVLFQSVGVKFTLGLERYTEITIRYDSRFFVSVAILFYMIFFQFLFLLTIRFYLRFVLNKINSRQILTKFNDPSFV